MSNVTAVVSAMPGASGFTVAVFKADEMPVGSVVRLADPSAASAALAYTTPLPDDFWNLVASCGGTKDLGKNARLLQEWVKGYAREAIAASSPKCELTDDEIIAQWLEFDTLQDLMVSTVLRFGRAIAAASGPNAGLVEALKMCAGVLAGATLSKRSLTDALEKARAALAAAGIKEHP